MDAEGGMSNEIAGREAPAADRLWRNLRRIDEALAHRSGGEFYRGLADAFAETLGACDVAISEVGVENDQANILGSRTRPDLPPAGGSRSLRGTAAGQVARGGEESCEAGARTAYPDDERLARTYAEAYLGVPVVDARDDVVAFVELIWDAPVSNLDDAREMVAVFLARILVELERSQAEAALRDSELRYRALIEDSFHLVAEVVDERLVYTSAGYGDALGYDAEDVLGGSLYDLIHPDDRRTVAAELHAMILNRTAGRFTVRMRHKNGSWRWIESTARAFRASTGEYRTSLFSRDMTDQLQASETLRESEERFRTLIKDLSVGVVVQDAEARIIVANEAAFTLLGVTEDQLLGVTSFDPRWNVIHPDGRDFPGETHPVPVAIATKAPVRDVIMGIYRPVTDDRVWLLVCAEPQFQADGSVRQVICSFTDVTARVTAEKDLRDSEARFRLLAENATDVIVTFDRDGVCTWVSPSVATVTGYAPEDLIGTLPRLLVHADDADPMLDKREEVLASHGVVTSEFRFQHKDGHFLWMESKSRSIRDGETGEVVQIQLTARDITARKQAEQDVRESEARFRLLAENANDVIARYDADGICLWISPSVTAVTGYEPQEIIGVNLAELIQDFDEVLREDAEGALRSGTETFSTTFPVAHKDGRRIWLEATNRLIRDPETGRVIEIHTSSRDVTVRKEAEDALRRSEQLFRATLESTADGILVTKPDATLLFWNNRAAEMLEIPESVLIGGEARAFVTHVAGRATNAQDLIRAIANAPRDEAANLGVWSGSGGKQFELYAHPLTTADGGRLRVWSIRDVTAEKAGEEARRASEERFRSLADHTSDLVLGVVGAGVIDYASPNAQSILGYEPGSLIGANAMDIVHEDDLVRIFEDFERAATTGEAAESTMRVKHGNGELRWFEVTSNFFRNERDELRAVVTARDVNEQKLAQDALRESQERLRAVVNSAPLVLFAVAADRKFILAEGEALRTVDLTSSDLVGHTIDEIYADFPSILADVERALSGEEFVTQDRVGDVEFQAHYAPTRAADGSVTGMIGVAYDITSRVRAEQALRESEETARALLNAPTDGAVLVDREGIILAMNATAERRFNEHAEKQGLTGRDFIGTRVFDLFAPELRAQRRARNDEVFEAGERRHFEDERDGVWTDVTIDPVFDAEGKVRRLAIFSRDITDRKRDEAALRKRSRELEALNDYLEKTSSELEHSQDELREASEQLAQLLEAEQARSKTDPLTGVLNHGAISEVISESIGAQVDFAVAMVDVDGMKAVNDTYGHQAGDEVLLAVTRAISRGGAIVGRYGGDEFIVALLNVDGDEASEYKAAVDEALKEAVVIDPESGARVPVVASVGIAVYPAEGVTLPELVEHADEKMYAEKRARQGAGTGLSSSRILGSERAARMVGEMVPLLTSGESLADKLRLVAHRLSVGAGYAGVNFDVFDEDSSGDATTATQNAFTKAPEDVIDEWNRQQRAGENDTGVGEIVRETRRPMMIDDIETSPYVTETQRKLLLSVGIRSGIVVPLFMGDTMLATMSVGSKELSGFGPSDEQFLTAVAGQVAAIIKMAKLVEHLQQATDRLENSRDETVMLLAAAAEAHSQSAGHHYEHVRIVSERIATEMGFSDERVREIGVAAALHDVGKIRVPDALLSSPERVSFGTGAGLGQDDWELLQQHCEHGRDFLVRTEFELAAEVAYTHHERWDGGGYPRGIAGEEIPLESAIIAVADSLDAIMSERAYQAGRPLDIAMAEIITNRGTQFRPDVVDALVEIYERGDLIGVWDTQHDDGELAA